MRDLIERLEKDGFADRGIDADIYCLINPEMLRRDTPHLWHRAEFQIPNGSGFCHASYYTSSIDAALSLVTFPEWEVKSVPNRSSYVARIFDGLAVYRGEAKTAPIALCIASLKARITELK